MILHRSCSGSYFTKEVQRLSVGPDERITDSDYKEFVGNKKPEQQFSNLLDAIALMYANAVFNAEDTAKLRPKETWTENINLE